MTLSIVARDLETNDLGAAVTSRFFAVGSIVPWTRSGVGAVCTQALSDPRFGVRVLQALEAGIPVKLAVDGLMDGRENRGHAQLHGIAADGMTAAFTGAECIEWSGSCAGDNASVAGNMLAGPGVVDATLEVFVASTGRPLAERLLRAIIAGERAGGDKRGKQSAAVVVHGARSHADVNLRVDDHPDPVAELWRIYEVGHARYFGFLAAMRDDAPDRDLLERRVEAWTAEHGNVDFSEFWSRDPWKD